MSARKVFISYKHEAPWTAMAEKFRIKLDNYDVDYFIDSEQIDVGDQWRKSVESALAGCTHFLSLLSDTYWASNECRGEVNAILARRQAGETVRPMFVLAEAMKPHRLKLSASGQPTGEVATVGDFQFLGPFDAHRRLYPLSDIDALHWGGAIEKMLDKLLP